MIVKMAVNIIAAQSHIPRQFSVSLSPFKIMVKTEPI